MRMPWFSNKEMRELQEWWDRRKKRAEMLGKTPVRWQPRGKLRKFKKRPKAIDSKPEQGYTADITSLSSENPLPSHGQGILAVKDKDRK